MNYINYFFNPSHLFLMRPGAMQARAIIILAIIFGLMIVLGFVSLTLSKKNKDILKVKSLKKFFNAFLTMGIIGYVYVVFAWQGIALLAARFWILIIFLVLIVWIFFIAKHLFNKVPELRSEIDKKRDFEKYIP